MNDTQLHRAEGQFVRAQLKHMLTERRFALILESDSDHDGWRAEFLGQVDDEDVVLLAHKPFGAPFATMCLTMTIDGFDGHEDCLRLMECTSDFDIAAYLPQGQATVHIASRLLLSGINAHDFEFTLNNLLFCRESILVEFDAGDEE